MKRVRASEHPGTLELQVDLTRLTAEAGDPATARDQYVAMLAGADRILTLTTSYAVGTGRLGLRTRRQATRSELAIRTPPCFPTLSAP